MFLDIFEALVYAVIRGLLGQYYFLSLYISGKGRDSFKSRLLCLLEVPHRYYITGKMRTEVTSASKRANVAMSRLRMEESHMDFSTVCICICIRRGSDCGLWIVDCGLWIVESNRGETWMDGARLLIAVLRNIREWLRLASCVLHLSSVSAPFTRGCQHCGHSAKSATSTINVDRQQV